MIDTAAQVAGPIPPDTHLMEFLEAMSYALLNRERNRCTGDTHPCHH